MIIKIQPLEIENSEYTVHISKQMMETLSLPAEITIQCGLLEQKVSIHPIKTEENVLYCSRSCLHTLHLPVESFKIRALIKNERRLIFSPVIAILTEIYPEHESSLFGSITAFCDEIAQYCQRHGFFFYVCSLKSLLAPDIQGYIKVHDHWSLADVPYPDVVHNRLHSRKIEKSPLFQQAVEMMQNRGTPYFNAHFLDKWSVFTLLSTFDHLQPYLPETYQLRKKDDLIDALAAHSGIFLKPVHGSQGKHIFRIQQDERLYRVDYTTFSQPYEKEYPTFQSLFEALYTQLQKQGFLIQKALPLQTYKGCPFDFRILCHRVKETTWKVTSAVARVSQQGNFVSNLARGGEIAHVNGVLQEIYDPLTSRQITKLLKELALDICHCLTVSTDGLFAELGIDLAIDTDGHPWIIEVNTKPSKQHDSITDKTVRPSTKAIVHYCAYLSGHSTEEV
ncbi:glutathione synthase/RimK-type ligase-like ATP-grasp enzyme [Bacillus fengqiuensis]|nr:glutathione synthase/RimK-type ligase-like ATP-grasp enzyme [Bacillus fengqiuensis]